MKVFFVSIEVADPRLENNCSVGWRVFKVICSWWVHARFYNLPSQGGAEEKTQRFLEEVLL